MDALFAAMRRLHERGPRARGLVVDAEGVALGPDCELVKRTPMGYRCASLDEVVLLRRTAFGDTPRLRRLPTVLASITAAMP